MTRRLNCGDEEDLEIASEFAVFLDKTGSGCAHAANMHIFRLKLNLLKAQALGSDITKRLREDMERAMFSDLQSNKASRVPDFKGVRAQITGKDKNNK